MKALTPEQVLAEIRRIVDVRGPDSPQVKANLSRLVNRAGAAELLVHVLRQGSLFDAHLAALALPFARNQLVRVGVRKEARRAVGERRAIFLAALTEQELEEILGEGTEGLSDDLVQASGMLAVNSPAEFVELVCEGSPVVDRRSVDHVERVRRTFLIGAASLYGPLLDRRLTPDARHQVIHLLGREFGPAVQGLLEREQTRATVDAERTYVRRERMRQASLGLGQVDKAQSREGRALVAPLQAQDAVVIELFEKLGDSRVLRSTVLVTLGGFVDRLSRPEEGTIESVVEKASGSFAFAELSLGQGRALLEALPSKRKEALLPLLDRFAAVPLEEVGPPAPGPELSIAQARLLVLDVAWREWRPLGKIAQLDEALVSTTAGLAPEAFPGTFEQHENAAEQVVCETFAKRGLAAKLAAGLRHMAMVMLLRGDPRAPGVSTAAIQTAKRRPTALLRAIAERELWLQLWMQGALPQSYRAPLREALRSRLGPARGVLELQVLDLAQAAAEGLARGNVDDAPGPGLPALEQLDLELAVGLAREAQALFSKPKWQQRIHADPVETITEAAKKWVAEAPVSAAFELAQFAANVCFSDCPHRCFDQPTGVDAPTLIALRYPPGADHPS